MLFRSLVKRYGAIFTCLALRAVHLEISHTLDTDPFILALRRFIARSGQVKEIRSDNGTNFTFAFFVLRVRIFLHIVYLAFIVIFRASSSFSCAWSGLQFNV